MPDTPTALIAGAEDVDWWPGVVLAKSAFSNAAAESIAYATVNAQASLGGDWPPPAKLLASDGTQADMASATALRRCQHIGFTGATFSVVDNTRQVQAVRLWFQSNLAYPAAGAGSGRVHVLVSYAGIWQTAVGGTADPYVGGAAPATLRRMSLSIGIERAQSDMDLRNQFRLNSRSSFRTPSLDDRNRNH